MGVEPSKEIEISFLPESIVAGEYLAPEDGRWVVVGTKLAEQLNIKVGKNSVIASRSIVIEDLPDSSFFRNKI